MAQFFTQNAAKDYLNLSDAAYEIGLIGRKEYEDRLRLLRSCTDPATREDLGISSDERGDYLHEEDEDAQTTSEDQEAPDQPGESEDQGTSGPDSSGEPNDPTLHFIARGIPGLSRWEFHPGDADFFPSVPHGHSGRQKLDAYRGLFYNGDYDWIFVGIEPRKRIIALWNDDDFREMARTAVYHYMKTNPHFRWRVRSPLRLPRKR